jgi:hypothetical protein
MRLHGLKRSQQHSVVRKRPLTECYASCAWPPPPGADAEGYSDIHPETDYDDLWVHREELGGTAEVDIRSSGCRGYEVTFVFHQMGDNEQFKVTVMGGRIVDDGGRRLRAWAFQNPEPTQVVVHFSLHESPTYVRCIKD